MIKDGGVIEYVESNKIGMVDRDKKQPRGYEEKYFNEF